MTSDCWRTYRARPVTIRARGPVARPEVCHTHNGDVVAQPGCYVIREPDGKGEYPCDPETFRRRWESVAVEVTIGARVAALRRARGWTQQQLADRLSKPRTHAAMSDIERGRNRIGVRLLEELAAALGVTVGDLMQEERAADGR